MAWDPALLRKYNSTSHFRLLNQLRSELKDQPIQRPLASSRPESTRRSTRTSESSQRRRNPSVTTPAPRIEQDPFEAIVTVPLLLDAFQPEHG